MGFVGGVDEEFEVEFGEEGVEEGEEVGWEGLVGVEGVVVIFEVVDEIEEECFFYFGDG